VVAEHMGAGAGDQAGEPAQEIRWLQGHAGDAAGTGPGTLDLFSTPKVRKKFYVIRM